MKKYVKIAGAIILPLYIAVYVLFFFPQKDPVSDDGAKAAAKIAELWHVDLFEGGSGSRGEFLKQRAINFESMESGNFILIKNMTYQQMIHSLLEGQRPDMFSYSAGAAIDILHDLRAFGGSVQVFENLLDSGIIEDKVFAMPWCSGGYVIAGITEYLSDENADFSKMLADSAKSKGKSMLYSFITGYSMYNNPMLAALNANKNIKLTENSFDERETYTQYEAYSRFTSKNASVFLLGTQRDAVRLTGRENASDFTIQAVKGYNDLVCYISIQKDTPNYGMCEKFIEYLLSESTQRKLTQINMFSVNTEGLYNDGIMREIEKEIKNNFVLNAFISKEILSQNRELALLAVKGDSDAAKKIWEMLP